MCTHVREYTAHEAVSSVLKCRTLDTQGGGRQSKDELWLCVFENKCQFPWLRVLPAPLTTKKKKNEASSHLPSSQKSLSHHLILRPVVTGWLILLMHSMDLGAWWCHSSNWDHFLWPTSCIFPPIKTCLFFHNPLSASIIQHYFPTEDDSNYLKGPLLEVIAYLIWESSISCVPGTMLYSRHFIH